MRARPTLFVASAGCAMTVLDTNVVAIALPSIARDLGASFAEVEWVVSAYVLAFASLLLPAGAIADRYGRRRLFLAGIGAFALTSLGCGLASTPTALFAWRALQGVSAAFLLAPALAIVGHSFPAGRERDAAWAIWGAIMGIAMVLSPLLGGALTALASWRWAFLVNLPACLILAAAALRWTPESRNEAARRLDPAGIFLFAATMLGLTSTLIHGQEHGWTAPGTLARLTAGAAALLLLVRAESRHPEPMIDPGLFRQRMFLGAILAMFAYAACAQVMASLLPLLLQNGFALPAIAAGAAMLAFAAAMLVFPQVGRRLGARLAGYQILALGLAVVAAGNLLTATAAHGGAYLPLLAGMFVIGAGGGLLNGETQKAVMGTIPPHRAGMASGISTTSRFTGILLGFATLNAILATTARHRLAGTPGGASFADAVVAGDLPRALAALPLTEQAAALTAARHAYAAGFGAALLTAAALALGAALAVLSLMRPATLGAPAADRQAARGGANDEDSAATRSERPCACLD